MKTIPAKTIITKSKKPSAWFGTDYNMNIYRGCCHGCIYCDSRSDCYRNFDFGTVKAKENALQIVRDDLRRKVKTGVVASLCKQNDLLYDMKDVTHAYKRSYTNEQLSLFH